MTVKGRRIFNRRPVCFFAFFLAAGILVAEAFYAIPHLYRLIPLLLAVVVTASFALKGKLRRAVYLPLAFLIGFLSCTGAADVYDSRLVEDCSGTFTARVSSDIIVRDGMAEFYVEDLVVDGVVTDGECEVRVPLDVPDFGAGDIVVLKGDLTASRHEAFDTFFAADALGGTYHSLRAESAEFLAAGEPDAILKVQLAVAKLFYENTDADTSAVARALVIGDQRSIDDLYYDSIQASGLAHVLSVSGLHITALSTALYFLLGKLRVNKKAALVIVLAISLVYVALCDFVPPAVRSLVMTAVFNFASAFGLKKDSLSSLAAPVLRPARRFPALGVLHLRHPDVRRAVQAHPHERCGQSRAAEGGGDGRGRRRRPRDCTASPPYRQGISRRIRSPALSRKSRRSKRRKSRGRERVCSA